MDDSGATTEFDHARCSGQDITSSRTRRGRAFRNDKGRDAAAIA
jgi:hypothetical protein